MNIVFGGQDILLHHSGIALVNGATAIASDLHLEKGSHFAKRGHFLPPYDSEMTLHTLLTFCATNAVSRLILLGDYFHDPAAYQRMPASAKEMLSNLLRYNPILIEGNHDGGLVPDGFMAVTEYVLDNIYYTHEATPQDRIEISGHFHPKVDIIYKGARISRRCFIEDGRKMILPAIGSYTGGLKIQSPAIKNIFEHPTRIYALGKNKTYAFMD